MDELLVVGGCGPPPRNTSHLFTRFWRQPLELNLEKDFHLLRGQESYGDSSGLACRGLDRDRVWVFRLLRFRRHATPPFGATKGGRRLRVMEGQSGVKKPIRFYQ